MSDATGTTLPASQHYRQARERLREAELRLRLDPLPGGRGDWMPSEGH